MASQPVPLIELDACRPVLVDREKPAAKPDGTKPDNGKAAAS